MSEMFKQKHQINLLSSSNRGSENVISRQTIANDSKKSKTGGNCSRMFILLDIGYVGENLLGQCDFAERIIWLAIHVVTFLFEEYCFLKQL